jgi:TolB protein
VWVLAVLGALGPGAVSAHATSPGLNGRLACEGNRPIGAPPVVGINRTEVFTINPDGTGETVLTSNNVRDGDPSFSPDGMTIAFESFRDGNSEVYRSGADGNGVTRLTNTAAATEDRGTSWSPDGRTIVFHSTRDGNYELYTMNADGTNQTRITNNPAQDSLPAWSPDGAKIAFVSSRDGDAEIYTVNPDGTNPARLTVSPGEDSQPSWSPDGRQITFHSTRTGRIDIYRMNADGGHPTRLTFTPDDSEYFPVWSPDGTRIAYNGTDPLSGDTDVYTVNAVDGSDVTRVTTAPGFDGRCDWDTLAVPPSAGTSSPAPSLLSVAVPLTVTGVGVTNRTFAVGHDSTDRTGVAARRKRKHGTTFRYTLSERATVTIALALRRPGRRRGTRCVSSARTLRQAPNCVRFTAGGALTRASHEGSNAVLFSGRIGRTALSPGRYQATLIATDSARNVSRPKTVFFRIVKDH